MAKGSGLLQHETGRGFRHRRELAAFSQPPAVDAVSQFTLGRAAKGRTCAPDAVPVNDGGRITVLALLVLTKGLLLPGLALRERRVDDLWAGRCLGLLNLITYCNYGLDQFAALDDRLHWKMSHTIQSYFAHPPQRRG